MEMALPHTREGPMLKTLFFIISTSVVSGCHVHPGQWEEVPCERCLKETERYIGISEIDTLRERLKTVSKNLKKIKPQRKSIEVGSKK